MSINLADELGNKQLFILLICLVNKELVILLIFVNNDHFVNAVTMGKVSHVDKMRMQTMREHEFEAKSNNSCVHRHKQWKLSTMQQICRDARLAQIASDSE